jgi:hypothetical protein
MNFNLLLENLTNPALLFFVLGVLGVYLKSDLEIPPNSSKFISLYLLFAIGFKGGQELSHEAITMEIGWSMLFGIFISLMIPLYTFFIQVGVSPNCLFRLVRHQPIGKIKNPKQNASDFFVASHKIGHDVSNFLKQSFS